MFSQQAFCGNCTNGLPGAQAYTGAKVEHTSHGTPGASAIDHCEKVSVVASVHGPPMGQGPPSCSPTALHYEHCFSPGTIPSTSSAVTIGTFTVSREGTFSISSIHKHCWDLPHVLRMDLLCLHPLQSPLEPSPYPERGPSPYHLSQSHC